MSTTCAVLIQDANPPVKATSMEYSTSMFSRGAKMPADILIIVFVAFTRWSALDVSLFCDDRMLLCLVCREWRDIVYTYAPMWTSLPVTLGTRRKFLEDVLDNRTQLADIRLFLQMDPSIRIMARASDRIRELRPRSIESFLENSFPVLERHLPRVNRLTIYCPSQATWLLIAGRISRRASSLGSLKRLSVTLRCGSSWILASHGSLGFSETVPIPALHGLRELRLTGVTPLWGGPAAFSRLTVLRLVRYRQGLAISWREMAHTLETTTSLELLEMNEVECTHFDGRTVMLKSLTALELTYSDPVTMDAVSFLLMPKLVCLNLQVLSTIDIFLDRCSDLLVGLQQFTLWVNVAQLTLVQATSLFRNAQHLRLLDMHAVPPIVFSHVLTLLDCSDFALPQLEQLLVAYPVARNDAARIVVPRVPPRVAYPFTLVTGGVSLSSEVWTMREGILTSERLSFRTKHSSICSDWVLRDPLL
ncbi:hypothetical protein B0H11DRAFT_2229307 [Mycena galericulata]|nr:hypothetical protein B0H11DRAFT_2229307 [Mycena galericulata]